VVSHHAVARNAAETARMRVVGALAGFAPSLAVIQVLVNSRDYRQPAVAVAVWLAVLGAAAWLVPRLRAGPLATGEAVAAITVAVAAVAAIGAAHRPDDDPASFDMAILGTAWLLALVVLSRPARVWIPGALLVYAVHSALLVADDGVNSLSLSQLEAAAYILVTILIAFAALRSTLATHATVSARRASLASRAAAERAAVAAIQQERQVRLRALEREALPLLRAIADGTLDPRAESVAHECAGHAAALRHSLTDGAPAEGMLVAALEQSLSSARAEGLLVTVQAIGGVRTPPPALARAILETLDAVLGALPPHHVLLTLIDSGDDAEIFLTFDALPPAMPGLARFGADMPAAAGWHAAVIAAESGGGCLEIAWRQDGGR
jgi:hypothetical protein